MWTTLYTAGTLNIVTNFSVYRYFLRILSGQICAQLNKAKQSVFRQRRIHSDRVYLNAIREARRLLTEGIALNPECDMLHLELLKLEANAADFFKSRILPRMFGDQITETNADEGGNQSATQTITQTAGENDTQPIVNVSRPRKRIKSVPKEVREDNEILVSCMF